MTIFKKMLQSNKSFYSKLKSKEGVSQGTLLFDVFFDEKALIYGVSKVSLSIASLLSLTPLAIIPQKMSKSNSKLMESMCFDVTGSRKSLLFSFFVNLYRIVPLILKCNTPQSLLSLKYDNYILGSYIYDAILRAYSMPTIEVMSNRVRLRVLIEILYFFHFKGLIKSRNVKYIVCSDNVYRYGLLFELAKINSIPCVSAVNLNNFSMAQYLKREDFDVHCRRADTEFLSQIHAEAAEASLRAYFSKRYTAGMEQHDVLKAYSKSKRLLSRSELECEYQLNSSLPIVIVMAHIFCDAPHAYPGTLYSDYYEWIKRSLDCLSKNKEVNFLVKEHPSASLYGEEGILLGILSSLGLQGKLLKHDVHNATVLNEADVVVTCGGTIGQEFAYNRKPVVLAAKPPYSGYGFTVESDSQNEYEGLLLDGVQALATLSDQQYQMVNKVLFYDFIKQGCYTDDIEIGGQRYYLGRDFQYDSFFERIIEENCTPLSEQMIYSKLSQFILLGQRHILNES